jgi:hypothetical protein
MFKLKRMRREVYATQMDEKRNACTLLMGRLERKGLLGRPKRR